MTSDYTFFKKDSVIFVKFLKFSGFFRGTFLEETKDAIGENVS